MRRIAGVAVVAAVAMCSPPAFCQSGAATSDADPAAVPSGTYKIDPAHTQVVFSVMHLGITPYRGVFSAAAGQLILDARDPAASQVYVSVAASSVYTTSPKLTSELNSAQWLDSAKYPEISFRSTKVSVTQPGAADIAGTLTLHGVSRPVVLHARFVASGQNPIVHLLNVGFTASATIRRSDFGVAADIPMVGDETTLTITAAFMP